jgi:hypothetical protein
MIPSQYFSLQQLWQDLDKDLCPDLLEEMKQDPKAAIRKIVKVPSEADYAKYDAQTVQQLRESIQQDNNLVDLIRYDPAYFLRKKVKAPLPPQFRMYRLLITCLCVALILIIGGALAGWFIKNSKTPPDSLIAIAAAIVGLLAGMFIHLPKGGEQDKLP